MPVPPTSVRSLPPVGEGSAPNSQRELPQPTGDAMAVTLTPIPDIPMVRPGDDLAALLIAACERSALAPADGDVLVVAQKIVSKAEGRYVDLADVQPVGARARARRRGRQGPAPGRGHSRRIAARGAPPARRADRRAPARLHHGQCRRRPLQCRSGRCGAEPVLLLPRDPDASAAGLRDRLAAHFRKRARRSIITDSWGRAWRRGTVGVALGAAGLPALMDLRGRPDLFGHALRVTQTGFADEIASAASLLMGQADEAQPGGAGAWPHLVGSARAGRHADPRGGRGPVPVSAAEASGKSLVVALSGGIGGAKLVLGLSRVMPAADLVVVANTGDDFEHLGLAISPDLDTVMYTLAGLDDPQRGWGRRDETWTFMAALAALGGETWFQLGDGDLATHVERTRRRAAGETLSAVTADFCRRLGIAARLLPMSDDPVRTRLRTARRLARLPGLFRAPPLRARGARAGL